MTCLHPSLPSSININIDTREGPYSVATPFLVLYCLRHWSRLKSITATSILHWVCHANLPSNGVSAGIPLHSTPPTNSSWWLATAEAQHGLRSDSHKVQKLKANARPPDTSATSFWPTLAYSLALAITRTRVLTPPHSTMRPRPR